MNEEHARKIAEEELRRINDLFALDVRIASTLHIGPSWLFRTTGRGSEPGRPEYLTGISVHEDGRVITGLTLDRPDEQRARFRASLASADDLQWLIPRNKGDFDRAHAVVALGYPAVDPILPALLEWLQDMNWPITRVLGPFLAGIGAPLAPHLRTILGGSDGTWKYWIVGHIIGSNAELFEIFRDELKRIADDPTPEERREEIDEQAREVLAQGPTPWLPERMA